MSVKLDLQRKPALLTSGLTKEKYDPGLVFLEICRIMYPPICELPVCKSFDDAYYTHAHAQCPQKRDVYFSSRSLLSSTSLSVAMLVNAHHLMTGVMSMSLLAVSMSLNITLDARLVVDVVESTSSLVGVIELALILEAVAAIVRGRINAVWLLDELQTHTAVSVPDDVTMHDPGTRVVGLETNNGPATLRGTLRTSDTEEKRGITADRVGEVEAAGLVGGEDTLALAQDSEIVTVQMHGVRSDEVVLDDEVNPVSCGAIKNNVVGVDGVVERDRWQESHVLERRVVVVNGDGAGTQRAGAVGAKVGSGSQVPSGNRAIAVEGLLCGVTTGQESCVGSEALLGTAVLGHEGNQAGEGLILAVS